MTTMVPVCPYCGRVECICPALGGGPVPASAVASAFPSPSATPGGARLTRPTAAPPPS
ncbi:hypothetical protein [Streptomyces longispororuber]|uniref:hypothetical protein n=1 Tax=Streptomyces longispororuber TaxID=68230 RepID=UPI00167E5287|nr:hypothetical protein [Streptomyces longispororuber]